MADLFPGTHPALRKILLSFFLTVAAALTEFLLHRLCIFGKTVRLVQKYHCLFPVKIVRKSQTAFFCLLFRRRINGNLFQIFQRSLALSIKASD